jgi:hypothetical protein
MFDAMSAIASRRVPSLLKPMLSVVTNTCDLYHKGKMAMFHSKMVQKGDLCFDVSANVGKHTKFFFELGQR